jgi:2-phosphoglycerate kinase
MAKLQIINAKDGTAVPFLRGILTRSLQLAGLSFDDAYGVASEIRDSLADDSSIRTDQLTKRVAGRLRKSHGEAAVRRYLALGDPAAPIIVRDEGGQTLPFSMETHRRALQCCGLTEALAAQLSDKLYRHLVMRNRTEISSSYLRRLTYRFVHREVGEETARRFLVWRQFRVQGWPLLLLIGGAPGCGKSTIATELASRLDIFRTQSTDMLREVMRMMIPERLLPVLHKSSFDAWQVLPDKKPGDELEERVVRGYRSQSELLFVSCDAVIQRAMRERVSLVLEGVHVDATLVKRLSVERDVVIVPVMLAVLKKEQLRHRIQGRGGGVPLRRAKRYLQNFDAIWQLQSYLLDEADHHGVSIVTNDDKEETTREIMRIVVDHLATNLEASLDKVFPGQ